MNADSKAVLSVQNVSFSFRGKTKKTILREVSFEIQPGEIFALVGHNGAGKTTLFHLILGYKFADRGEITLGGKNAFDSNSRQGLGYVPERAYLPVEQSFSSYLKYLGDLQDFDRSSLKGEIERVAKEVGLHHVMHQPMRSFSKGMLQKTMLAQALLGKPRLMILDEPMSGLDPEAREQLRARIHAWKNEGKAVLFSTHALEDVEELADRVMVLDQGVRTFLGTKTEWMKHSQENSHGGQS